MSAFWKIAIVVTLLYVVYYAVTIFLDLSRTPGRKRQKVETISVSDMQPDKPKRTTVRESEEALAAAKRAAAEPVQPAAEPVQPAEAAGTTAPSSAVDRSEDVERFFSSQPTQPVAHFGGLYGKTLNEQLTSSKNRETTEIAVQVI